jgi:hypothetical protein
MAYNMNYTTVPSWGSDSIGGIIPGAYSSYVTLGSPILLNTRPINTIFDISLNPGAYIFTSSIFSISPTAFVLQSVLYLNNSSSALSSATTNVPANGGITNYGGNVSNCFAFNVSNLSSLKFDVNFTTLPDKSATTVGDWSLMRIG